MLHENFVINTWPNLAISIKITNAQPLLGIYPTDTFPCDEMKQVSYGQTFRLFLVFLPLQSELQWIFLYSLMDFHKVNTPYSRNWNYQHPPHTLFGHRSLTYCPDLYRHRLAFEIYMNGILHCVFLSFFSPHYICEYIILFLMSISSISSGHLSMVSAFSIRLLRNSIMEILVHKWYKRWKSTVMCPFGKMRQPNLLSQNITQWRLFVE